MMFQLSGYSNLILCAAFLFIVHLSDGGPSGPKLLSWGEQCADAKGNLLTYGDCDVARGITCQLYSQGWYCGCPQKSRLSYDKQSQECRRKPLELCFNDPVREVANQLNANEKCHERAMCAQSNSSSSYICVCKEGFKLDAARTECIEESKSGQGSVIPQVGIILTTLWLLVSCRTSCFSRLIGLVS